MSPEAARAAREVIEQTGPRLRGIFAFYRIPETDAEDIKQDALLALVRSWPRIDFPEGWLIGTVFRLCRKYHFKRKRPEFPQAVAPWLLEALAPEREPEQMRFEKLRDLSILLRHLQKRERIILQLRFQGLSQAEMAKCLGYRQSSIGKMTARALAKARAVARQLTAQAGGREKGAFPPSGD